MKLTRSAFLIAAVPMLLGAAAAGASAVSRKRRKLVFTGIITNLKRQDGVIEIKRSGHLHVTSVIVTDEDTVFVRPDDTEGSFDDLVEGAKIKAKGFLNSDASLQADRVVIISLPNPEE